jgi:2'-hydroxyisoflavone reductase
MAAEGDPTLEPASHPLRLLILGGTRFVGRHLAAAALARGHAVTLVHRGQTNPGLFPEAEHLLGDRGGDLSFLSGRRWDAAVDVNGYVPRLVRASAARLAGAVERYVFISTVSAYAGLSAAGATEEAPLAQPPSKQAEQTEEVTGETYGWLKALCEREAAAAFPGRTLIVRPGLLVGPEDHTGRFAYWPWRFARGGEILAPDAPGSAVQLLDARDLGEWIVRQVESGATGVYNATGPESPLTLGGILSTVREIANPTAAITWVDPDFLLARGVAPWSELPLWLPGESGFNRVDNRRARAAGLTFRPLAETVRDTLRWLQGLGGILLVSADRSPQLTPERESELLREWCDLKIASC